MPSLMFPTEIDLEVTQESGQVLVLALGLTTFVNLTATRQVSFSGLRASGGSVHGMVVTFASLNPTDGFAFRFDHENGSVAQEDRFRNGSTSEIRQIGTSLTYRFHGGRRRWICLMCTR